MKTKKVQAHYSEEDDDDVRSDGYDYEDQASDQEISDQDDDQSDDGQSDDDQSDDDQQQEEQAAKLQRLKRSLAHVSFEQLADINQKMHGEPATHDTTKKPSKAQILKDLKAASKKLKSTRKPKAKEEMKRSSKHSPMEMSSKRAVSRLRSVVETQAVKHRDPRFDKLSGKLNQDLFEKSYDFINDYKKDEQAQLQQRLTKTKDPEERAELKDKLSKMKSQEKNDLDRKRKQALARERKKAEAELVKQGKTPYFLKKSEKRKLELMDKYSQLGDKSIDRIMEKRRKQNSNKDHRRLPFKRRSGQ
ncbi:hypothetical protein BC940DRAFT_301225 [Gongronella butleri]|nr:hypothetical protein BC940DRAFT_301225 [Gongronella butleri]